MIKFILISPISPKYFYQNKGRLSIFNKIEKYFSGFSYDIITFFFYKFLIHLDSLYYIIYWYPSFFRYYFVLIYVCTIFDVYNANCSNLNFNRFVISNCLLQQNLCLESSPIFYHRYWTSFALMILTLEWCWVADCDDFGNLPFCSIFKFKLFNYTCIPGSETNNKNIPRANKRASSWLWPKYLVQSFVVNSGHRLIIVKLHAKRANAIRGHS